MTKREAFMLGAAETCAERGVLPSNVSLRLRVKSGNWLTSVLGTATGALGMGGKALRDALIVGVPTAAAAVGWGLGGSSRVSKSDLDAMRQTALLYEYAEAIRRLKQQKKAKEFATPV